MSGTQHSSKAREPSPLRPWDRKGVLPESLDQVATHDGPYSGRTLYWIPGVVLATVESKEQALDAMTDLHLSLGASGTSYGVLMLYPDVQRASLPSDEVLAAGRIRVVEREAYGAYLNKDHQGLPERFLASLGGESRDRLKRHLRGRRQHT